MEMVRIADSTAVAIEVVAGIEGQRPASVATCARPHARAIGYAQLRGMLTEERPYLLLFGTAWGLAPEVIAAADHVLAPIFGVTDYNHLSVRCAAAIVLDRLLGR
jgi:hypothetical protein